MKIEDLQLAIRTKHALFNNGIRTVEEILKLTAENICSFRDCGKSTVRQLREKLLVHGLCLAGETMVSSQYGMDLIRDIPSKLESIRGALHEISVATRDIFALIDQVVVSKGTKKIQ